MNEGSLLQNAVFTYCVLVNIRKCFFTTLKVGGGCHHTFSNNPFNQYNALKSWPYTSKFTIENPVQIGSIFKVN